jgi:hypothetical protein
VAPSSGKQAVINAAISEIGSSRPTGYGQEGECFVSVRRWLRAGGYWLGYGGPTSSYTNSGAYEVAIGAGQPGDVIQYAPIGYDDWVDGVHTMLIVGVNANGTYQIVESNNPGGSGLVGRRNSVWPNPPAGLKAHVWRF